jgi:hypothetical protein
VRAIGYSFVPAIVAMAAFCGILGQARQAHAEFIITVSQDGSNVVATGSGTIDTAALTDEGGADEGGATGYGERLVVGGTTAVSVNLWGGISGPASFGPDVDPFTLATSGTGDVVGIITDAGIYLSTDYVSGSALSGTATWADQTLSGLGMTPGDYVWTWGTGATADSFDVVINGVPEPASLMLIGLPLIGLALMRQRRRPSIHA